MIKYSSGVIHFLQDQAIVIFFTFAYNNQGLIWETSQKQSRNKFSVPAMKPDMVLGQRLLATLSQGAGGFLQSVDSTAIFALTVQAHSQYTYSAG